MHHHIAIHTRRRWLPTTGLLLIAGCAPFLQHISEERSGNVTVLIINNTPYRAALTAAMWDSLDRDPPGQIVIQQERIEAGQSAQFTIACRRNFAIGTEEMVQRVIDTNTDQNTQNFDNDAFDSVVHFSNAPADAATAALPTVGTAEGREVLLGLDFSCGDLLIFTLEQDPTAAGGFRIDFEVIPDVEQDQ